MKVNLRRKALGQNPLTDPAGSENVQPFPLVKFFITNHDGRVALKFIVSRGSAEGVIVSSWQPISAGRMVRHKFIRLGLLPAAVRGVRDFTKLYVAKFGVPSVGTEIFIRLRQMNDYRRNMAQTLSAVVHAASRHFG
jgi:hypothetical protein